MANPEVVSNDSRPLIVENQVFEEHTILAGENPVKGNLLGQVDIALGAVAADGGNTGDGTVTEFALAAGGPAKIGTYDLECVETDANGAKTPGAVVPDGGNTGDGTVTEFAISALGSAKEGDYILECTETEENGAKAAGTVTADGGNTGDGTSSAATLGADAKAGTYTLTCVEAIANAGRFQVADPNGNRLADLNIATAYVSTAINLTISDGANDFIVGDIWTIAVTIVDGGKFKLTAPSGTIVKDDILLPGTALGNIVVVADGITFKLTDGATDFVLGDKFTLPVSIVHGGKFRLTAPDGTVLKGDILLPGTTLGNVVVISGGITFKLTDGATDFILGDKFTMIIGAGSLKLKVFTTTANDGSQIPKFVNPETITNAADAIRDVCKSAKVVAELLVLPGGVTLETIVAGQTVDTWLRNVGIITKSGSNLDYYDNL